MLLNEPIINAYQEILPEEAKSFLANEVWEDSPALRLVVQDAQKAESGENKRAWLQGWEQARDLYNSYFTQQFWPGSQMESASVNFFTVATAVNGINPQILAGLFYENPPFIAQERPGTTAQASRAVAALLGYQLEDINFREELRLGCMNFLLFGTALFQEGWEKYTKQRKIVKRKNPSVTIKSAIPGAPPTTIADDELEVEIIEEVIDRPTFEHIVNLREILIDPGLDVPDIRKAKYVIRRRYMTWEDLDKLRDREGYDIPSREKLLELFLPPVEAAESNPQQEGGRNPLWDGRADSPWEKTTVDPFQQPLEVLERWDNNTYIVVLQKKLVIYNDKNVYGKIPFRSVGWWDSPGQFWSMGLGRSQPLNAKILTPDGWTTMGELTIGSKVIGSDGKSHFVTGTYPQGERDVYRVHFSDGSSTECCKEHLWTVETRTKIDQKPGWRTRTLELQEIWGDLKSKSGHHQKKYRIPTISPVEFDSQIQPLDPYLVGLLLGDGGMTTETPKFTTADPELIDRINEVLPENTKITKIPKLEYDYKFTSLDGKCNVIRRATRDLGINCTSRYKFIPDVYKFGSIDQRKDVLAGLMDTDGSALSNGTCQFYTTSERLRDDVKFLVQSLGGSVTVSTKRRKEGWEKTWTGIGKPSDRQFILTIGITFNPFRLTRKVEKHVPRTKYQPSRFIKSVELVEKKECQCIMVDSFDHLYATDDCILTHNTIGTEQRVQTGITNLVMNIANLKLNAPMVRVKGKSVPTQSIRIGPNRMIEVDNQGDIEPMKFGDPVVEASQLFQMSQQRVGEVSGNNPVSSSPAGHSNMARSSAGAQGLLQSSSNVVSEAVDKLANQVIVPFLYDMQEMNQMMLPLSQLDFIMSEELKHEYVTQGGDLIDILNARVKFSILAGSKMQTRRNMAQGLPMLSQFLANPEILQQLSVEGKKVDVNEVVRMWFEASDWRNINDVIIPMTDEDKQRQQQQSQGGALQQKAQLDMQKQQQAFQQKQQLEDQSNTARAARDVLREGFKHAVEPEELTGTPSATTGFGSLP